MYLRLLENFVVTGTIPSSAYTPRRWLENVLVKKIKSEYFDSKPHLEVFCQRRLIENTLKAIQSEVKELWFYCVLHTCKKYKLQKCGKLVCKMKLQKSVTSNFIWSGRLCERRFKTIPPSLKLVSKHGQLTVFFTINTAPFYSHGRRAK